MSERVPGGFAAVYKVLSAFEESGRCRRGYFVEGLGAAQFGTAGAIDRLRTFTEVGAGDKPTAVALAATDPANPYGAALPWPDRVAAEPQAGGRPPPGPQGRRHGGAGRRRAHALRRARRPHPADLVRRRPSGSTRLRRGARRCRPPRRARPAHGREGGRRAAARRRRHTRCARPCRPPASSPPRGDCGSVPEGDTVYRAARMLDRALTGQLAHRSATSGCPSSPPPTCPAATSTAPWSARQAPADPDRRRRPEARPCTPTSRWRAWHLYQPGQRWRRPGAPGPGGAATATEGGRRLLARHRRAAPPGREDEAVGHLGPDLLGPDWDEDEALRRLRDQPDRPVWRGAARPDPPGRHRQHVRRGAVLHQRRAPAHAGRRRARPDPDGPPRPADARAQQGAGRPVHDRRPAPRRADVGLPPRQAALPPLRHPRAVAMLGPAGRERATYWCPSCQPEDARSPAPTGSGGGGDDLAARAR